jgi:predicted ATP-grasp superfamily ATP-dependent carboligase
LARYRLDSGYVHPYELGSVVWCETCHDEEAVEAAQALIKRSGYTGVATVEFRRDARHNSLFLTKFEQRTVRATSLSRAIGMDIPTALYSAFTGGAPRVASDYRDGVGWIWLQAYAASILRMRTRWELMRAIARIHAVRAFGEDLSDPVPLAAGAGRLALREIKRPFRIVQAQNPAPVTPAE